jgi:kinesin family protein 3/17
MFSTSGTPQNIQNKSNSYSTQVSPFQSQNQSYNYNNNNVNIQNEQNQKGTPMVQNYGNKTSTDNGNNFKVMVRVRPPLPRETDSGRFISTIQVNPDNKKVTIYEYYNVDAVDPEHWKEYYESTNMFTMHAFTFDYVYDQDSSQVEVYENTAKPAVMSTLQGYNATILAYGQTGTGKTHTMEGFKYNSQDPQRGIIPRSMEEIFQYIENVSNSKTTFMVRASYLQIYNEVISDLLRTDRTNLHIREDKKRGVFVEGLSEWAVRSPNEIYSLMQKGAMSRATASTKMNDVSSRSHAVFIIIVEQMSTIDDDMSGNGPKEIRVGKLNLVDLAGSERVRVTGATGKRLEECKKINQSLSALGNVISALTDHKQPKTHIPYRDSKITRLLEDSLGGNCITTMMAMVSPALEAFGESLSSLKFANRAKNIRNEPIINEDVDQKALLRKYEFELLKLRTELDERNKHLIDKKRVFQLEEDKKRAEQDKVAAVNALEARSKEFMNEREEKKKLEEKIRVMYSQVLVGGRKIEDTPQFRTALEEQQKLIRQQYEKRLNDLEKERYLIEEDKAQVDRYKQLLLKQRDIMIALTTRLNERDETIIQLQEELDAYDRIHRETEDILEIKSARVSQLEAILKENNIPVPKESNDNEVLTSFRRGNESERGFIQNNHEIVNYDGQETYNITRNNLSNAEEKIAELTQVADSQKNEINRLRAELENIQNNTFDTSEFMKTEIHILSDKVKKSEEGQHNLKEAIKKKDEEIWQLQRGNSTKGFAGCQNQIKQSLDSIIECLSSENEPYKLQNVARELLTLQKLVNESLPEEKANSLSQLLSEKSSPTNNIQSKAISSNHRHANSEVPTASDSIPQQRNSPTKSHIVNHTGSSLHGENPNLKKLQSQANYGRNILEQSKSYNSLNNRKEGELDHGNRLESKNSGLYGNYFDNNPASINPSRQAMSVEEMLQIKRNESAKKK